MPILALHHRNPVTNQTHGPVAQIVMSPMAFRDRVIAEQPACDFAVARVLEPPIQGAQCEEQAVAPSCRQCGQIRAWRTSRGGAPQSQRGHGALLEQLIERQNDGDRFAARFHYCVRAKLPVGMPEHEIRISDRRCKQFRNRHGEVRTDKFRRRRRKRDYAGECRRRPQRWLCVSIEETQPEIAPPNDARRRLLDLGSICGGALGWRVACAPVEIRNFG